MRVHFKRSHPDVRLDETKIQKVSASHSNLIPNHSSGLSTDQLTQTADWHEISAARTRPFESNEQDLRTLVPVLFPKPTRSNMAQKYRHMKSEWPKNVYLAR